MLVLTTLLSCAGPNIARPPARAAVVTNPVSVDTFRGTGLLTDLLVAETLGAQDSDFATCNPGRLAGDVQCWFDTGRGGFTDAIVCSWVEPHAGETGAAVLPCLQSLVSSVQWPSLQGRSKGAFRVHFRP